MMLGNESHLEFGILLVEGDTFHLCGKVSGVQWGFIYLFLFLFKNKLFIGRLGRF